MSSRSPARRAPRRAVAVLAATATAAAGGAVLLAPATGSASSHREAPYILFDPAVDNTDVYAFVSPDDADTVTMIANWHPFSDPAGGPNFFPWDPTAAYDINIDNDGDAKPDKIYRWTFNDQDRRDDVDRGAGNGGKGTFLYADGPVTSFDDENLLFKQTYRLSEITPAEEGTPARELVLIPQGKVAPSNVGIATIPDYLPLLREAITPVPTGGQSYVGQADDPFFLDLRVFDLLYGANLSQVGFDTLAGYNVNTIALKVPKSDLAAAGDVTANPVVGIWSTTSRQKNRVFQDTNAAPVTDDDAKSPDETTNTGDFVQVSRLGNPLVNEVVVPAHLKDYFNRLTPDNDGALLGKVQDPELPALIESIYDIPNPNKLDNEAAKKRNDLVAAFLTGFSRDVFAGRTFGGAGAGVLDADLNSLDLNAVSPSPQPAEYLRLNMTVPPKAPGQQGFSRLGAIGGDLAGFPNGRRLQDDVVDIALQVVEGVLVRPDGAVKTAVAGLGDAVSSNDADNQNFRTGFLRSFPYIAAPHTGSDPREGQTPVSFRQDFTSSNGRITANVQNISPAQPNGFAQLYRVNADGSVTGLGTSQLNAAGTGLREPKVVSARVGSNVTLNWRVFTNRVSAAQSNRGVPTTVTVR